MSKIKRQRSDIPPGLAHIEGFNTKAILRRRGVFLRQQTNQQLKAAALPLAEALVKKKRSPQKVASPLRKTNKNTIPEPQTYASFTNADAKAYWEKLIHNVTILEEHFDHAVKNFLINNVLQKALANIESVIDTHKNVKAQTKALRVVAKQVFDDGETEDLVSQAQIDLEPLLQNMGIIAGQDANKLIGTDNPYIPSEALRKLIQSNVEKFTVSMVNTDQQYLIDIITNGIANGDSVPDIARQIKNDFTDYSSMQANRITRTEVLRSANQSTLDAFKQSGVVSGQQWLTAGADDECADYEGQVETLDGSFYASGDDPFKDGEPPLHPNCRCVLIPVIMDSGGDVTDSGNALDDSGS